MSLSGAFIGAFLVLWISARWWYAPDRWRPAGGLLIAGVAGVLALTLLGAGLYVRAPGYWDHLEPALAMKAQAVARGEPAYPGVDAAVRTQLVYGPAAFLPNAALGHLFQDPMAGSKIVAMTTGALALAILLAAVARRGGSGGPWAMLCTLLAFGLFRQIIFRHQADSLVMVGIVTALAGVITGSRTWTPLLWALGFAIATATKLHAALFVVPFIPVFLASHGFRTVALSTAAGGVLSLVPFGLERFDLHAYRDGLVAVSRHGLEPGLLVRNLATAGVLAVPLGVTWWARGTRTQPAKGTGGMAAATVLSVIGVCVVGAKEGAGLHHLLPLCATFPLLCMTVADERSAGSADGRVSNRARQSLIGAWVLAVLFQGAMVQRSYIRFLGTPSSDAFQTDARLLAAALMRGAPGRVAIGYTDDGAYGRMWVRPLFARVISTDLFEPLSIADMARAGHPIGDATLTGIANQTVDTFILPSDGVPFSMTNWYDREQPLFGKALTEIFQSNYHVHERHGAFTVWRANRLLRDLALLPR